VPEGFSARFNKSPCKSARKKKNAVIQTLFAQAFGLGCLSLSVRAATEE
jgi:hypothetical protein